ncbi:peptidoglycan DD-metalloendopeptidase family protein [Pedobacter sp. HMF7647]|uniref:Peptidoglycan DD-metalloendopeptidase family protein n=1 Tax=Hufsiella arboris TaxID=2695275 RepID=A0A7K1Y9C2_9SPHI|nr:M23 family metallopeptidase [Hufsiella arboris]MXV50638.1 peptidoglycan DD-metalloendopeptidase family protein [Hufsiella arboris]
MFRYQPLIFLLCSVLFFSACNTTGPAGLFKKLTPHEIYGNKIKNAGLQQTAMGRQWFQAADNSLNKPLKIQIPYKETGYFASDRINATALQFNATRGEKLTFSLAKNPATDFSVFMDIWRQEANDRSLMASADTSGKVLELEIKRTGTYLLRLQPELLRSGEYTLTITSGPSLSFPVSSSGNPRIESVFGADRDAGIRRHEGIDIFATFRTPVLAAAEGTVQPGDNNLGGKVVFLRPKDADYTLYYAHLDSQTVSYGQNVRPGDTIGLVGNTGNARTTPSHLHFGIYSNEGAIDPLVFIKKTTVKPPTIAAKINFLNDSMRTATPGTRLMQATNVETSAELLPAGIPVLVEAATANYFKVTLPDNHSGFISASQLVSIDKTIRKLTLSSNYELLQNPDALSAKKAVLVQGNQVNVIGEFNRFYLVKNNGLTGWIKK